VWEKYDLRVILETDRSLKSVAGLQNPTWDALLYTMAALFSAA
jgi:hypothetical protein